MIATISMCMWFFSRKTQHSSCISQDTLLDEGGQYQVALYCFSIASILNSCITALLHSSFAVWVAVLSWKSLALNALITSLFPWTCFLHLVASRKLTLVGFITHILLEEFNSFTGLSYFATLRSAGWIDPGGWKRPASGPHFLWFFCGPLCIAEENSERSLQCCWLLPQDLFKLCCLML